MTYFPLDRQILTSSIWSEQPALLKTWLYLLLVADPRDGVVRETVPAISQRCGLPLPEAERILARLEEPDKYSRTPDHDGRRIERTEEGIRILTYELHRDRDYSTPRVKKWRERRRKEEAEAEAGKPERGRKRETKRNAVSPFHETPGPPNETVKQSETTFETTDTDTDTDTDMRDQSDPSSCVGSLGAADAAHRWGPVMWIDHGQRLEVDREWLRREVAPLVREAGVDLTDDELDGELEQLRLRLVAEPKLRAYLHRPCDGQPSKPSQFERLATFTSGQVGQAIRRKASSRRPREGSTSARSAATDEAFKVAMERALEQEGAEDRGDRQHLEEYLEEEGVPFDD